MCGDKTKRYVAGIKSNPKNILTTINGKYNVKIWRLTHLMNSFGFLAETMIPVSPWSLVSNDSLEGLSQLPGTQRFTRPPLWEATPALSGQSWLTACERCACLLPCQLLPLTSKHGDRTTDFTNQSHPSTWTDGQ